MLRGQSGLYTVHALIIWRNQNDRPMQRKYGINLYIVLQVGVATCLFKNSLV